MIVIILNGKGSPNRLRSAWVASGFFNFFFNMICWSCLFLCVFLLLFYIVRYGREEHKPNFSEMNHSYCQSSRDLTQNNDTKKQEIKYISCRCSFIGVIAIYISHMSSKLCYMWKGQS